MAKTGGSLMGRADSTLVGAAFREGESRTPADLKDVYTKREEAFKAFQEGISTIFENLGEEDRKEKEELEKELGVTHDSIMNSPKINDRLLEINDRVANEYKQQLKDAKTNLEKSKIRANYNRYANVTRANDEIFSNITEMGVDNLLLTKPGSNEQKLLIKMLKDYNNNTAETNPEYDPQKGDIVYTDKDTGAKMSLSELQRKVNRKDNTSSVEIGKELEKILKNTNNQPWEDAGNVPGMKTDAENNIFSKLNSSDDIINAGQYRFQGLEYSVEELLTGQVKDGYNNPLMSELFDVLKGVDGDFDGSGVIDSKDATFITAQNGKELALNIMKNESLYKKVIAKTVTNMAGKKAFDISQIKKETETPKWKIPGTPEWERVRKANLELTNPIKTPFSADSSYGPKGSTVKGRQINNYWNMLNSGKMSINDIPYNRNTETGAWVNSQDQTEISGNKMLDEIQKALNKDAGDKQTYNILNDQNFKQFSGATTSGTYTMPKDQESMVAQLWSDAAAGAKRSTESHAVGELNRMFYPGQEIFTEEDAGNKWTIGYGGKTYNLKVAADKDNLLKAIKAQKLLDQ